MPVAFLARRSDSWIVVHIHSLARPGATMEGTRLTLVRVPNQPDGYEFSIRTPVTPPRWKDFDVELEAAFEGVLVALEKGACCGVWAGWALTAGAAWTPVTHEPFSVLGMSQATCRCWRLRFSRTVTTGERLPLRGTAGCMWLRVWRIITPAPVALARYNFMPLARGTAAVGYTSMLSMFWAAGMPVTAPIPKDYQVEFMHC
jgi:hypothetical protein